MRRTSFDHGQPRGVTENQGDWRAAEGALAPPSRSVDRIASLLRAMADSPNPLFVTNRHNRIVFWNDGARRILGFTAEEAIGASCAALLEGCDLHGNRYCSENCAVHQMATRHETIRPFVLHLRGRDLRPVTADVSILHLTTETPEDFFLVHLLNPFPASLTEARAEPAPPRSVLEASRRSRDPRIRSLTPREVEVIAMLASGQSTPGIAAALHISVATARNHIQNILAKLEVHSKAQAVSYAFKKRLFEIL